jgi:hypothetical protein
MVGNTLKMTSWIFAYLLLAKANPYGMAALEVATMLVWWLLSLYLVSLNGALGATQAFAATYALYTVATFAGAAVVIRRMSTAVPQVASS